MAIPEEGKAAPAFSLPSRDGKKISLKDFKDKKHVVLYFYPRDNTPGCTREACSFNDNLKKIEALDAVVLGVSRDSLNSHEKFIDKYELTFPLLSDEDESVCKKYDALKEKTMYGKKVMGIVRSTFVIGKDGKIAKIFRNIKVDGHTEQVIEALQAL